MKAKGLLILLVLAAAAAAAAWLLAFRSGGAGAERVGGDRLVPGLAERGGETARVEITSGEQTIELRRDGETWRLETKGGYPAEADRVRRLITTLSELREIEPKTSNPGYHDRLAVQWPDEGGGGEDGPAIRPTLVRVLDAQGEPIAEVVLGETDFSGGATRQFARILTEPQSWLVSAEVDVPTDPMRWLDRRMIELERERVRSVTITHPDGAIVTVAREAVEEDFAVRDVPEGMRPISEGLANRVGSALSLVNFTDVRAAGGEMGEPVSAVFETFDGLRLELGIGPADDGAWLALEASGEGSEAINDRLAGWEFKVPQATAERLTQRPTDLLEEAEPTQGPPQDVPELLRPPGDG